MNQMLINVSTRKFARSVRLPEGDVPGPAGAGLSKSAASRRFVALSAARMKDWMASDLSGLDLLVIQIDGIHMDEDLILVAAIGVDAKGDKHPLGLTEGATENAATVQSLIDNLVERGLNPAVPRLFIIDGAKALSKAIRRTFGRAAAIQRCRNFTRRATSWSDCPSRCMPQFAACCDKHGSWTTPTRPRKAASQHRPASRTRLVGGRRLDPGRHRRNPHHHAPWIAEGAAALARLYQHHQECHEHGAARMPEREAMALGLDGDALDRGRHAGSGQRLPTTEGSQAASSVAGRPGSSPQQKLTRRPCSPGHRRLTSISAATASQCSTKSGTSPRSRRWLNELITDPTASAESIAKREQCSVRKVNRTLSLAFLAPDLVKAAIDGRLPHGMGVTRLADLPAEWSRQRQILGLAS